MTDRVRGMLVTPAGSVLTIRRERPGIPPYWVLPGGGVEPGDASLEGALIREVEEELAARPHIHGLLHVVDDQDGPQYIFLARIDTWSGENRTGPEFADPTRGSYHPEPVPLTVESLAAIDLKPAAVAEFLTRHIADGQDLFTLPDLRIAR
jgi:8-oxo-dGTP pyrophosphatase MutT (NUDIX family)